MKETGVEGKKYILTKETKLLQDQTKVYRIQAVMDFKDVKQGDLGGFVESEENLSQKGSCWVYGDAIACQEAKISQEATLANRCQARGKALIFGNAKLLGNVLVDREGQVYGTAYLNGLIVVTDYVWVCGDARIEGARRLEGRTIIDGDIISNDVNLSVYEL